MMGSGFGPGGRGAPRREDRTRTYKTQEAKKRTSKGKIAKKKGAKGEKYKGCED